METTFGFISNEEALKASAEVLKGFDAHTEDAYNMGVGKLAHLQFGDLTSKIPVLIRGVSVYNNHKKLDLEMAILGANGWHPTRIYNVHSDYIFDIGEV